MFRLGRDTRLKQATWVKVDTAEIEYVEAWKYSKDDECRSDNFRHGVLHDSELDMWLRQTGKFAKPSAPVDAGTLEGTIRILFCEIPLGQIDKPRFLLELQSFVKIEKAFHLPCGTIEAAFHRQGLYSRSFDYDNSKKLECVKILVKAAQKVHVANYILSLSYQARTASTTALIMGTELLKTPPPRYAFVDDIRKAEHLLELIRNAPRFWTHPMLLPTILLQNHSARAEKYTYNLGQEVLNLEHQAGVAFPDQMLRQRERSQMQLYAMTKHLHANMVQILFMNRIYNWEIQYATFLQKTHNELTGLSEHLEKQGFHQELQECIEHITSVVTELADFARILKERTQSQLDIVYNFVAQNDASTSTNIAVSSGRDSVAMKTLAFITALFLPGSFVASLFSMTMFNWQASSSADGRVVSHSFWIYWVITVPLTALVLLSWKFWWEHENKVYHQQLLAANTESSNLPQGKIRR